MSQFSASAADLGTNLGIVHQEASGVTYEPVGEHQAATAAHAIAAEAVIWIPRDSDEYETDDGTMYDEAADCQITPAALTAVSVVPKPNDRIVRGGVTWVVYRVLQSDALWTLVVVRSRRQERVAGDQPYRAQRRGPSGRT